MFCKCRFENVACVSLWFIYNPTSGNRTTSANLKHNPKNNRKFTGIYQTSASTLLRKNSRQYIKDDNLSSSEIRNNGSFRTFPCETLTLISFTKRSSVLIIPNGHELLQPTLQQLSFRFLNRTNDISRGVISFPSPKKQASQNSEECCLFLWVIGGNKNVLEGKNRGNSLHRDFEVSDCCCRLGKLGCISRDGEGPLNGWMDKGRVCK